MTKPDNADSLLAAVRSARDLIDTHGYQPFWQVSSGPLNISNALKRACGLDDLYVRARQSFSKTWGGPVDGLLSWETQQRRSKAEVLDLFDQVLERLESGEAHPVGRVPRGRSSRNT